MQTLINSQHGGREEVTRLLAAIDPSRDLGPRDLAITVLFLDTGLRLSELMSLRLADVHL